MQTRNTVAEKERYFSAPLRLRNRHAVKQPQHFLTKRLFSRFRRHGRRRILFRVFLLILDLSDLLRHTLCDRLLFLFLCNVEQAGADRPDLVLRLSRNLLRRCL